MSDIKKLGKIEGHVSAVFNAYEIAFIGSHLNKVCDTVNQLIDEVSKLRMEVNDLKERGEWGKNGECPFCSYLRQWEDDNFCGHCGAKMKKGGAENE